MEMDDHKRRRNMVLYVLIACVIYLVLNTLLFPNMAQRQQQISEVSFTQLLDDLKANDVKDVEYNNSSLEIRYTKDGDENTIYTTTAVSGAQDILVDRIDESDANLVASVDQDNSLWTYMLLMYGLPLIIFFALGVWLNRRMKKAAGDDGPSMNFGGGFGGMGGGLGKSGARIVASKDVGVTFKDVAGQEEAKESLKEVVDFLENPKRYEDIGARLPRGALLVGPPGTGKTLLAKAVAGEAGVPFFSISGSEFVEMFVGRGAAKVRDLFKQANEKAPCIVFIDEIDAVGKRRDGSLSSNDEREQTLNQLLTEMDGFDNHKGIVVLAATNRPDSLDPALLRPGRFDRRIPVELPDLAGRKAILELHAKDVKVEPPIDLTAIARATPGASGADLSNIINEGALRAVRMGRRRATQEDFEESVEVVIAGQKRKSTVLSDHEKQVVSYHEIGHAIVAANMKDGAPVTKITIVPRTSGALGYTMQVEEDEKFLTTKQEVLDKLAVYCGGRAAEELIFGEMTTGAANDIEQATKLARNMITRFGMSEEFGMMALGTVQNAYLNQDASLTCAPGTAERVDEAVKKVIEDAHARAIQVLKENKFKLHELARYLYKKETITGEEFMTLLKRENPLMPPKPQA
ncbi:ATP-dependent zinc metalloprotease FtsH [Collinsella sp. An2]|uniref:ATP-dependent zinc metalloprotease FtsH n=1 Tax=Collinsella sp. An2 TaxID=1965585 RepID=UPI0019528A40|nr:ATP-dependent zinc metalloprotease FtsH [Collinsella sp. An2]